MGLLSNSTGEDPCSLLNASTTTGYPTLWLSTTAEVSLIASAGALKTFLSSLPTAKTRNVLTNADANSSFRLKKYLSSTATTLDSILLKKNNSIVGIIDSYVTGSAGLNIANYTYSTSSAPKLPDDKIWSPADQSADGSVSAASSSLLGKLLSDGHLLKQSEIYSTVQGSALTLLDLYIKKQKEGLNDSETTALTRLENKNLKFFSAFLAEYCFYKTRYSWLLAKFFSVYSVKPNDYSSPSSSVQITGFSPEFSALFSKTTGAGENQAAKSYGIISQQDYLKVLGYHLACLSTRMKDMRRLLEAVNTYYNTTLTVIQQRLEDANVPGSNGDLTKVITALNNSTEESKQYMTEADFKKEAMDYAKQKGEYANVLLGLYAFLNISALAMIFHIARS